MLRARDAGRIDIESGRGVLISQGRVSSLAGLPWAAITLTSDSRLEEVVLQIGRWASRHFPSSPFQLLFPVQSRDLSGISMLTPYLMARTLPLARLRAIGSLYGIRGLESDSRGLIMEIDDAFVQDVQSRAESIAQSWSSGILPGSFVRILLGHERMLCGDVTHLSNGHAEVRIQLRSRELLVKVPRLALLNLGDVPADDRHYFYVPGVTA